MKRFILLLFAILPLATFGKGYQEIHCKHFFYGYPAGTPRTNDLIIRDIYALSNNDQTKFADWVAYRLDKKTVNGKRKTSRRWKPDPWLSPSETLEPEDYKGAYRALHTDRGHQAPLASFDGTPDWPQTNYLSNITPQKSALNRGLWVLLEKRVRKLVNKFGEVYVMTGPLYNSRMPSLPGADEPHKVPSGYWKIICIKPKHSLNSIITAAYIFPQNTPRRGSLSQYMVSIDEVERQSGLDFLWELPDEIEARIERRTQ
jgi:endonuclease G